MYLKIVGLYLANMMLSSLKMDKKTDRAMLWNTYDPKGCYSVLQTSKNNWRNEKCWQKGISEKGQVAKQPELCTLHVAVSSV